MINGISTNPLELMWHTVLKGLTKSRMGAHVDIGTYQKCHP